MAVCFVIIFTTEFNAMHDTLLFLVCNNSIMMSSRENESRVVDIYRKFSGGGGGNIYK